MILGNTGNFAKNSLANAAATAIFAKSKIVFDKASRRLGSMLYLLVYKVSKGLSNDANYHSL